MEVFKLVRLKNFRDIWETGNRMINIPMKTSDFQSQFARDRELRLSRTITTLAPTNAPQSPLGDEPYYAVDGATSGMPMGYTHTRGVRMHIKVTNGDTPDRPDAATDDVPRSDDDEPAKQEQLPVKNGGPVLALMSVPASKGKSKG
jgi:hypothetical protein